MYSRVYIEITNICNMHCSFCHGHSRVPKQMTVQEFSYILDQLHGQTKYLYYHLMGEPFTHAALPDFLKLAKERGYKSVITTNGTLLKKRGTEIISSGVHKISISLHSFESGSDDGYVHYLSEVADFAEAASAAGIIVVLRHWNKGFDGGRNDTSLEFFRSRLSGSWAANTRGYRIRDKLFLEWGDRFQWPDLQAPRHDGPVSCYGLQDHFGILCDGSVVPCCMDSDGIITLGNIFRQDISEILASPRATAMVDGFRCRTASEELCRRCGFAQKFV